MVFLDERVTLPSSALVTCVSRYTFAPNVREPTEHPLTRRQRNLRHDPAHRFDEVKPHVIEGPAGVVRYEGRSEGRQLSEDLDPSESATDDHDLTEGATLPG